MNKKYVNSPIKLERVNNIKGDVEAIEPSASGGFFLDFLEDLKYIAMQTRLQWLK